MQLADVVKEYRPAQTIPVGVRQPELPRGEVRERPHTFAVPTGLPIVRGQRRDESQDLLRHPGGTLVDTALACLVDPPLEDADVARPTGHGEAGGSAIREHEGKRSNIASGRNRLPIRSANAAATVELTTRPRTQGILPNPSGIGSAAT
jgi:hypothetical protein